MPAAGFKPAVPTRERPQTYALDRAATWTGNSELIRKGRVNSNIVQG